MQLIPTQAVTWQLGGSEYDQFGFGDQDMPFRSSDYAGVCDQATLTQLQEIFDAVWLAATTGKISISRDELARLIFQAHKDGLDADAIKSKVIGALG